MDFLNSSSDEDDDKPPHRDLWNDMPPLVDDYSSDEEEAEEAEWEKAECINECEDQQPEASRRLYSKAQPFPDTGAREYRILGRLTQARANLVHHGE